MSIVVVMPAFDEVAKVGMLLAQMPPSMECHDLSTIVVDDGSTDGTGAAAAAHGAFVLTSSTNRGKGNALRRGVNHAMARQPDAVVWMDADGQHLPQSLPHVIGPVLAGTADMVVGSRYLVSSRLRAPLNRRLVRAATIAVLAMRTGRRLTDPFSGFRCFSPRAMGAAVIEGDGYECELEALLAVARAGLDVREVAIPRVYGPNTSKMGARHGALFGRLVVVWGYVRTLVGRSRVARTAQGRRGVRV